MRRFLNSVRAAAVCLALATPILAPSSARAETGITCYITITYTITTCDSAGHCVDNRFTYREYVACPGPL
jgi:hypothetical protein